MGGTLTDQARGALAEAGQVVARLDEASFESFARAIASAKRIALHGLGREGLQMKGLAMRLYHLGLDAHVVGEMPKPRLAPLQAATMAASNTTRELRLLGQTFTATVIDRAALPKRVVYSDFAAAPA